MHVLGNLKLQKDATAITDKNSLIWLGAKYESNFLKPFLSWKQFGFAAFLKEEEKYNRNARKSSLKRPAGLS